MGTPHQTICSATIPAATIAPRRRALVLQIGLLLGLWGLFAFSAYQGREQARSDAVTSLGNLAAALALDTAHKIDLLDKAIQSSGRAWSNDEIRALKPSLRSRVVFDGRASTQLFGPILIVDAFGALVAASSGQSGGDESYAGRPAFRAQTERPDAGLFVGLPFVDPSDGEWSLPLSRRLDASDGSFAGVVMGTLRLLPLRRAYQRIQLNNVAISLLSNDGALIERSPEPPVRLEDASARYDVVRSLPDAQQGWFQARCQVDGRERIFAYRRLEGLRLLELASEPVDLVYSEWRVRTLVMGALLALLSAGTLLLQQRLGRELHSREAAERKLQELAALDPLTGIANRRAFDDATAREWRTGGCRGTPVGLLMIDVDHFKPFNDRYGHLAGDRALAAVATAIAATAERHGGLASRYGGEEFAILLPAVAQQSIRAAAQDVIRAVSDLDIRSVVAPSGHLSVSVGAAAICPQNGILFEDLIVAADRQLYRAKADGRGCLAIEDPMEDERAAA